MTNESGADLVQLEKTRGSIFSISSALVAETINPLNAILNFGFTVGD
jgi:hypothetical protein